MSTILYVDDELAIQRAIRSLLARKGHTVLAASTIDEARATLAGHHVHGVFVDIWLGAESGFDLLEWIDLQRPELLERVALVTGEVALDPEMQRLAELYRRPVVTKPFDMSELERLIGEWAAL